MQGLAAVALLCAATARAAEPPKIAVIGDLPLERGGTIKDCRLEYRTLGTLNADRTNAVLFPTWFSGRTENLTGFVGPDEMLDPARHFVILVGALGDGLSSSPSNSTSQAGAAFPQFTIGDMVSAEKRLVSDVLHLDSLEAVIGISMGGMQAFDWAVRYPGFARRIIPIVGSPKLSPYDELLWRTELEIIEGTMAGRCDQAMRSHVMAAVGAVHELALSTPAHVNATLTRDGFDKWFGEKEASYAAGWDPYDWAAQLRAMLAQDLTAADGGSMIAAAARVKAPLLAVVSTQDHMVNPASAREFTMAAGGTLLELSGDCGHLANGCEAATVTAAVRKHLGDPGR
jgi:homoserine O-acetyltransferase